MEDKNKFSVTFKNNATEQELKEWMLDSLLKSSNMDLDSYIRKVIKCV